uniref:Uncharacterized protein n=1 Tax=Alexandrium andersonii TaxID=327968 RepID=A0A7S2AL15_9DINO
MPLLREHGAETFKMVTISVEVNSDAHNNGLGVVLEASPLMDCTVDEHGLPSYVYNGAGLSRDKKRSAVKFHPGMHGGMLRVEGTGGFGNSGVGFLPESWTGAARKFHTLRLTLGANGENLVRIDGAQEGQSWSNPWKHQLTEGRYTPAVYAWLDMVSINRPLFIGKITMQFHMEQ